MAAAFAQSTRPPTARAAASEGRTGGGHGRGLLVEAGGWLDTAAVAAGALAGALSQGRGQQRARRGRGRDRGHRVGDGNADHRRHLEQQAKDER